MLFAITNASGVIQKKFIYSDGHVPDYMLDAQGTVELSGTEKSQSRTLPISEELAILLSKSQKENGEVFKTYYREPFTRVKLTRTINEFKAKGIYRKNWNLLDLRHSFGVNFLGRGGSMNDLQKLMGHANVFDTKRIFGTHQAH